MLATGPRCWTILKIFGAIRQVQKLSTVNEPTNSRTFEAGRAGRVVPVTEKSTNKDMPWKHIALYVVLAIGFFLMGFVPMAFKAWQYAEEREAAQHEVRLKQMETQLAAAVINANRGEYERARQTASDFFTSLRTQIDRGSKSDLSTAQREKLKTLLSQRDEVITLLARSDPAALSRLSDIYVAYQKAMNEVTSRSLKKPEAGNTKAVALSSHLNKPGGGRHQTHTALR